MAKGHFRKYRYVVRYADGSGVGTSGIREIEKLLANQTHDSPVVSIETEIGDIRPADFIQERICSNG